MRLTLKFRRKSQVGPYAEALARAIASTHLGDDEMVAVSPPTHVDPTTADIDVQTTTAWTWNGPREGVFDGSAYGLPSPEWHAEVPGQNLASVEPTRTEEHEVDEDEDDEVAAPVWETYPADPADLAPTEPTVDEMFEQLVYGLDQTPAPAPPARPAPAAPAPATVDDDAVATAALARLGARMPQPAAAPAAPAAPVEPAGAPRWLTVAYQRHHGGRTVVLDPGDVEAIIAERDPAQGAGFASPYGPLVRVDGAGTTTATAVFAVAGGTDGGLARRIAASYRGRLPITALGGDEVTAQGGYID